MRGPFQVLSDCPACRVESAFVELIDPQDRLGVALEGECRLCRHRLELGLEVREGEHFSTPDAALAALARWAREDGEELARFTRVNFGGETPEVVAAALVAGERVETGFDVVAFLFPGSGGAAATPASDAASPAPDATSPSAEPPPPVAERPLVSGRVSLAGASAPVPERTWDPRNFGRALGTILVADGERLPSEQHFVDAWLQSRNLPPLAPEDVRVWRPHELGTPPDPAALLDAMRRCALADKEADGTEIRLLEEYARAWEVPLDRRQLAPPSPAAAFWNAFTELFVR